MVFGEHSSNRILIDLQVESQGYLIGDPLVAEARIPAFRFHNSRYQCRRWCFGSGPDRFPFW